MANPFVHVELNTTDVEKAKAFYSRLFDWRFEDMDMGPGGRYTMISPGDGTGGGIVRQMTPDAPSSWLAYVEVADVAASTSKARSLGAKVVVDTKEIAGAGTMSIIVDPTGATLALWKSKPRDQR